MKIITETVEDVTYIVEDKDAGGAFFIEGIIMQADIQNRNGRIYPSGILMKEMDRYNKVYVNENRAFGELNHPSSPVVNLDRVSHLFTKLEQDGSNIVGRAKILDTPMGKIVKSIMESGGKLGISSRGMGAIKKNVNGIPEIQEGFMLATAGDIVADPSAPDAFVRGVMEGVEYYYDVAEGTWRENNKTEQVLNEIKDTGKRSVKELEENASRLFEDFIKSFARK